MTAPPAFLRSIPDRLILRKDRQTPDLRRAVELIAWCAREGYRPSLFDIHNERQRRLAERGSR